MWIRTAAGLILIVVAACAGPAEPVAQPTDRAERVPLAGWPPRVGKPFPDLTFHDSNGDPVRVSSFAGKVVLVEPIGMNCPACNAFAGANESGRSGIDGTKPQANLLSVAKMLPAYADGASIDDPDLVLVHLLLYNMKMHAPTQADARRWAEHFDIDAANHLVLYADERFVNRDSYNLIPGFQLVDRNGIVQSDSTGHKPRDDLYAKLLPMLGRMLDAD